MGQTTDRSDEWSELSVVCPECGCTFGVWRSTMRPHHASARPTGATLASGSTSGEFQDGQWPPWSTCHCPAWLQPI